MDGLIVWSPGITLDDIERQVIIKAYAHFRNNKTTTANALGISIRTLDTKLERYRADADTTKGQEIERRKTREEQLARARGFAPAQYQNSAGHQIASGVRLEPASPVAAQLAVPVPQRQEVQEVLPIDASGGRPRRGRPRLHRADV